MAEPTRTRMTADERGAQVLAAAVAAFAENGYAATRTDEIARRAGVSQPYVIRLFGSKQQLFLAAVGHVCDRIESGFIDAAHSAGTDGPRGAGHNGTHSAEHDGAQGAAPNQKLAAMSDAFNLFLTERTLLRVLLHAFAAAGDPEVGPIIRERYGRIYQLIRDLSGASVTESRKFLSSGMLLTVMAALRVAGPDAEPAPWALEILDDLEQNFP